MNDPREGGGGLQFERAEYDQAAPADLVCASCGRGVGSTYYAANGKVLCERCKDDLDLHLHQGSRATRFLKAAVFGLAVGAVGAGVWYAVRAVTGYELGLLAVAVGFGVGTAVRKGSNGRGGWRYQALAMFVTYTSIVSTYVPDVVTGLQQMMEKDSQKAAVATPSPSSGATAAPAPVATAATTAAPTAAPPPAAPGRMVLALTLYMVFVFAIAFAAPFLGGVQNVMGIVIIGIALYEAWKINRKVPLQITGPHRVGTPPPAPPAAPGEAEVG